MPLVCEDEDPFALIVREIQQGICVEPNYERLCGCFRRLLVRFFTERYFSPSDAEDLCQEVLLKVVRGIPSFEGRSRFSFWVFEIAHNLYANEIRRRKAGMRQGREIPLVEEQGSGEEERRGCASALASTDPSPHEEAEYRERLARLRAALKTLPPQMRLCYYLRFYQSLKYCEVAEVMAVRIDTVKAHLGEARKRLRKLLS